MRAKREGLRNTNFLSWTRIHNAIPSKLKASNVTKNELGPLEFKCGENVFNPITSKSKRFYELLITKKAKVLRGFEKWIADVGLDDITAGMSLGFQVAG